MTESLLSQGLELMFYGMGSVLLFLTLLVFVTRAMSALVQRFAPETPAAKPSSSSQVSPELLAAIGAAVHCYRNETSPSSKPVTGSSSS